MPRPPRTALVLALTALSLSACGSSEEAAPPGDDGGKGTLSAPLKDPGGADKGAVEVSFTDDVVTLSVQATGLAPGLHGFHVHKTGRCEPNSTDPATPGTTGAFLSAGGHLAGPDQAHGNHDGDLPSLLVRADGSARLVVASDRLTRDALLDEDGSAIMVHDKPDNFGNVPDRYTTTPDETTTKTGDAGARVACAVLKR